MNTNSIIALHLANGSPFGKPKAQAALPHLMLLRNTTARQTRAEIDLLAQIVTLRKDMAKMPEYNNILFSNLDDTQK